MSTQRQRSPLQEWLKGKTYQLKGRLVYPSLFAPRVFKPGSAPKFEATIFFPPSENTVELQRLNSDIAEAKRMFYPNIPNHFWRSPLLDGNAPHPKGKQFRPYEQGNFSLKATAKDAYPPQVIMIDTNYPEGFRHLSAVDVAHVYDGQNIAMEISLGTMADESTGLCSYLNGVIIVGGGERMAMSTGGNIADSYAKFMSGAGMGQTQGQQQQGNQGGYNPNGQQQQGQQNYSNDQGQYNQGNGAQQGTGQYGGQGNTQGYGNQNPSNNGQNAQNGAYPSNNGGYNPNGNYNQNNNNGGYNPNGNGNAGNLI